jgi:anti-sigma regulatory factor (Ser/Thr protein kinase)
MQFIFKHNASELLPFLIETGQHIQDILPMAIDTNNLLHKCKYIITELCTNAIKHSGLPQTTFDIYIENSHLIIKRYGSGLPFYANAVDNNRLLIPHAVKGTVTLTEDDISKLCVQRIDEHSVRFFVEDANMPDIAERQSMGEHFGLIIICRSSDNFTYTRLPDALNIFSVSIRIA